MRKLDILFKSGIILLVTAIAQNVLDRIFDWTIAVLPTFSLSDILLVVGIIISVVLIVIGKWGGKNKETRLDPRFIHLEVRYSQRKDSPDTPEPSRPYFVVNKETKQAYWVSDLIAPYVKVKKIQWNTNDGEKALEKDFRKNDIDINTTNPMPKQLGLIFKRGSLIRQITEPEIVTKLKGHRLSDLEIMEIFPFRYRLPLLSITGKHSGARLLIKHSTKETYHVPRHDLELVDYGIIPHNSSIYRCPLFDNYKKWSKRKKYAYTPQHFSEEQLLAEIHS